MAFPPSLHTVRVYKLKIWILLCYAFLMGEPRNMEGLSLYFTRLRCTAWRIAWRKNFSGQMRKGWTCGQRPWVHACLFPVNRREEQEGLNKNGETKKKNSPEIKRKQTCYAVGRMSLSVYALRESIFLPRFHSCRSTPPPRPPEISFQWTKPWKNRPRVFTLTPVCKSLLF